MVLVVAFGGLLLLYVYFQAVSLLAAVYGVVPHWLAHIAVVVLCFFCYRCLGVGRLVLTYVRLRRNEQVRMSDLQQLQRHAQIRRGCSPSRQRHQARDVLKEYVIEYPKAEVEKTAPRHSAGVAAAAPPPRPPHASFFSRDQLSQLYYAQPPRRSCAVSKTPRNGWRSMR